MTDDIPAFTRVDAADPRGLRDSDLTPPRSKGRIAVSLIMLGVAVVLGAVWIIASNIQTADQAASEAAPPTPSVLTSTVERRILAKTVIVRGTVASSTAAEIDTPSLSDATSAVVTARFIDVGDTVESGQALMEISGRPVFILAGDLPAYRTLRPGSVGPDVAQLNAALSDLGYLTNTSDTFTGQTSAALNAFYVDRGYVPVPAIPSADIDRAALSADLARAEVEVTTAQTELDRLIRNGSRDTLVAAATQICDAAVSNRDAISLQLLTLVASSGPTVPFGEIQFVDAEAATVEAVNADLGETADAEPIVQLGGGGYKITAVISAAERRLIENGTRSVLLDEASGTEWEATVSRIADVPAGVSDGQPGFAIDLIPSDPLAPELLGANLRVTFTTAATDGEVLVVPLIAVASRPDGTPTVAVLADDGMTSEVEVTTGMTADGMIEVAPIDSTSLRAGDQVVVG